MSAIGRQKFQISKPLLLYMSSETSPQKKLSWKSYPQESSDREPFLMICPEENSLLWMKGSAFETSSRIPKGFSLKCFLRKDYIQKNARFLSSHWQPEEIPKGAGDFLLLLPPKDFEKKDWKPLWGTTGSLLKTSLKAASEGNPLSISLRGIGYRAFLQTYEGQDQQLGLRLGYSHEIFLKVPKNIQVWISADPAAYSGGGDSQLITLQGANLQEIRDFADQLRKLRPLEAYKGKGVLLRTPYHEKKLQRMRKEGKGKNA